MASLSNFTDALDDIINDSPPMSLASSIESNVACITTNETSINDTKAVNRPAKGTGLRGHFRSIQEIDEKYREVFTYPYFNLIQSSVIDDALYSDKSIVVCAPTGSGKTVIFEMAIVHLLMELEDKNYNEDFKIIYMAPVKALCTERLTEWYSKFTKLGLLCIEVTGDTDVDFSLLKPYKIIITTPEKWDVLTRRWRDHRGLVEVVKLFMIDEVHILNDESRGPVLEAVVSRMKTIESSAQAAYRLELLENQLYGTGMTHSAAPSIRFVAVSATVSNPEDVAKWLGTDKKPAVFHQFGDECRPVKLRRIVEGYHCPPGSSIFKFDIILNYKLWPIIQKYHSGKPILIFCNTRKGVILTAETLSRELTINFTEEQRAKLLALCSTIKNRKLQSLIMSGVGCHHAGLLIEERQTIERGFRNRDLPILITTTTLAMGVNLPAHLVIIKNTQQYVNGAYQEYSMSTVLQMIGRAGRPQYDTEATAVIMTRLADKARYQALVGGCEPLQSYLHKRLPENLNSEAALGTVGDVAQCVQWLSSTFLYVRAARDPKKYLNLPQNSPQHLVTKKIEDLCVIAMNGLASSGLITMDETGCIQSTEAGRLMSIFYLDLETMKQFMKIEGTESLERLVTLICESHELSDMYLRVDERRCLNALNRNKTTATIRFPMKGKITTKQMKLNCIIQAVLGCLTISDPSLNQEAMKIMRIAERVCKGIPLPICSTGLVAYVTSKDLISHRPQYYVAVLNSIILAKCIYAHLWENSPFVSRQLKGIGPTFSTLLASAGKVNFMLLEESHPRDLERIMNKGAPAGNVIRKQISLLPKYQLSMQPIDENSVSVELVLLNQSYLSENIEHLTAGTSHKSYIIVGDSENHILLLTSFSDKDLISVFNGTITHEIKRKLDNEHKIFAHCISSTFVGIDVHSEYIFDDLDPCKVLPVTPAKEVLEKQTYITDTFRHRKRNCPVEAAKTHCKEKKRRVNAIMESFNYLKNTFETASKNIEEQNINIITNDHENYQTNKIKENLHDTKLADNINVQDCIAECDDFLNNAEVDRILTEIECEMFNKKPVSGGISSSHITNMEQQYKSSTLTNYQRDSINKELMPCYVTPITASKAKRHKTSKTRSNYNYIDLLEKNVDLDDDHDKTIVLNDGFTDTIKGQINKYIQEAEVETKIVDTNVDLLFEDKPKVIINENKSLTKNTMTVSDNVNFLYLTQKLDPHFGIKEIQPEKAASEIVDTNLELLLDSKDVDTTKPNKSTPTTATHILYPNSASQKIREPQIKSKILPQDYKDKTVTYNSGGSIEKICSISNDTDDSSLTQKIDPYIRTNKTPTGEVATTDNCTEEIKDTDLSISIQGQNIYEEKKQITYDAGTIKQSNDGEKLLSYTKKEMYSSQTLGNGLDEIFAATHDFNKYIINQLQEENSQSNLNDNILLTTNTKTNISQSADRKNQFINTILKNDRDFDAETNNTKDMLEIKQNTVDNTCFKKNVLMTNKLHSIGQFAIETSEEKVQKLPATEQVDNLNIMPCATLTLKESDKSKFLINGATMAIEKVSMPNDYQDNFMVNKSLSRFDITKRDIITKHNSLKLDINKTPSARNKMNNTDSSHDQIIVQSNQSKVSLSDLIVNCSSNSPSCEYSTNNNKNNYSYETTKIGFHTNQSPVYSALQVVKSVKINFNITEVISTMPCKQQEVTNKYVSKKESFNTNEIENQNPTPFDSNKLPNCNQDINNVNITQNYIQEGTEGSNYNQLLRSRFITNSINNIRHTENSIPKQDIDNDSRMNISDQSYCSDNTETLNQKLDHGYKIRDIAEITETNKLKSNDDVLKSEENIQNILKKYSTIVRKNAASDHNSTQSASTRDVSSNNIPLKRTRKWSTISDIQKLQVTFPESIIDCHNETLEVKSPNIEQIPIDHPVSRINDLENLCEDFNDPDSGPVYKAVDLETVPDYNMDLSLFDPKVLLQSTLDIEDEIIPPPPQFRDNPIESYKSIVVSENHNINNIRQSQGSEFNYNTDFNYTDITLEDNFDATNLTPTREIETLILSEEDDLVDDIASNENDEKRRSSFDLPDSGKLPFKARLGQYKFNPKNKLRKWK